MYKILFFITILSFSGCGYNARGKAHVNSDGFLVVQYSYIDPGWPFYVTNIVEFKSKIGSLMKVNNGTISGYVLPEDIVTNKKLIGYVCIINGSDGREIESTLRIVDDLSSAVYTISPPDSKIEWNESSPQSKGVNRLELP